MFFQIPRCYDSHLHLLATGQIVDSLDLSLLKTENDVQFLKPLSQHFCGDWLLGFGWDQNRWALGDFPMSETLDRYFPNIPVAFSRADGHALWVNSLAMKLAGVVGPGVFLDQQMEPFQKIIPPFSLSQKKSFLQTGMQLMNRNGFTHIRDMSGEVEQWNILQEFENEGSLSLYVEQNIHVDSMQNLNLVFDFAKYAKKNQTKHIRVAAIKFFYDGALGSEGALLSQNYVGKNHSGLRLSSEKEMCYFIETCWQENFPVAVHTIGDQASYEVATAAWKVWQKGIRGQLNIEHGELIRPETIQLLKQMNSVVHMQPCHWLSDKVWLQQKLGDLYKCAFPWAALDRAGISIQWGSDSPIEPASIFNNLKALSESASAGISAFNSNPLNFYQHPNTNWGSNCRTYFEDQLIKRVIFDNKFIIEN